MQFVDCMRSECYAGLTIAFIVLIGFPLLTADELEWTFTWIISNGDLQRFYRWHCHNGPSMRLNCAVYLSPMSSYRDITYLCIYGSCYSMLSKLSFNFKPDYISHYSDECTEETQVKSQTSPFQRLGYNFNWFSV